MKDKYRSKGCLVCILCHDIQFYLISAQGRGTIRTYLPSKQQRYATQALNTLPPPGCSLEAIANGFSNLKVKVFLLDNIVS